jgi:hypothetical protein
MNPRKVANIVLTLVKLDMPPMIDLHDEFEASGRLCCQ